MIIVNRIGNSITGSCNGIPYGVSYEESKYQKMKDLSIQSQNCATMAELLEVIDEFKPLMTEGYKELVETACPYIYVNKATGKFYLQLNGDTISTRAIPQAFVDRILISVDKGIDFKPLIKCWTRFLRNPNYTDLKAKLFANYLNNTFTDKEYENQLLKDGYSTEVARERSTRYQTPVTEEGLICTYKVSREILNKFSFDADGNVKQSHRWKAMLDENTGIVSYQEPEYIEDRVFEPAIQRQSGDAFTCGDVKGHIIRVGYDHALEWDQVDTTDFNFGTKGLHCGNLNYIRGYQREGTVTHEVLIDPMDIGRFTDENDGAVVVRRYFVWKSFAGVNKNIYNSSTYAAITDAEYEKMVADAIEKTGKQTDQYLADERKKETEALALIDSNK